jgi:hypothetical protein
MRRSSCGRVLRATSLFTKDIVQTMISNMLAMKLSRTALALPAFGLVLLFCSCAQQTGETQSQYSNPGRPEVYSADERGYEKPWPFGDLGTNPQ